MQRHNHTAEFAWEEAKMTIVLVIVAVGSIIANILITALNYKLYTEYWKDITIKRRYEDKGK